MTKEIQIDQDSARTAGISLHDALVSAHESHKKRVQNFESQLRPLLGYFILLLDDLENDLDTILASKISTDLQANEPFNTSNLMLVMNELSLTRKVTLISKISKKQNTESFKKVSGAAASLNGLRNRLAHPRSVRSKLAVMFSWKGKDLNAFEKEGVAAIGEALRQMRDGMSFLFPESKEYFRQLLKSESIALRRAYALALKASSAKI